MKLAVIVLIFVGSYAFAGASGYDLKIDLAVNGKIVSSPRILVKAGEMGTIVQKNDAEESFVEVIATEGTINNHSGILMNFNIGFIDKNGKRNISSSPQILATENKPAQITVGEKNGTVMSLSVVAHRRTL
jgi:type II secretory pathway component HofQ